MKKKLLRKDGSTAWCGNIKPTGTEAGNLGAAVIAALAEGSVLRGANMSDSDMSGANMSDSDMRGANMSGANMSDSDMSGANMSNSDMRGANMSGANMSDSDMRGANMSGADMSDSDMSDSDMRGANMSGANMSGANMSGANMRGANMSGADMSGANIENANFTHADMRRCHRDDDAKLAHLNVCEWPVTIQFDGIHIGCKKFTLDEIMVMTEEIAASHHAAAPTRWRRWGKALQTLAQATLVHNKPEPETHGAVTPKPKRVRKSK